MSDVKTTDEEYFSDIQALDRYLNLRGEHVKNNDLNQMIKALYQTHFSERMLLDKFLTFKQYKSLEEFGKLNLAFTLRYGSETYNVQYNQACLLYIIKQNVYSPQTVILFRRTADHLMFKMTI